MHRHAEPRRHRAAGTRWAFVCLLALATGCARDVPPRHLVLVTIDTLRADRVGAYGHGRNITPHLDRLAARGVRFDDAIVQAIATSPSHASILTGLDPPGHGLRSIWGGRLAEEQETLAENLRAHGFATAAFVSGVPLNRGTSLDQGFDVYDEPKGRLETPAFRTNQRVFAWLASPPEGRVFLWVHYFDPHTPYYAPRDARAAVGVGAVTRQELVPRLDGRSAEPGAAHAGRSLERMQRLYDAEVLHADAELGELLAALDSAGLLEDAIVAVVADHGEMLGEDRYFFGHWDVLEPTAQVPMILAHPHGRFAGTVVEEPVASIDLVPTLLAWLGVPTQQRFDGLDLTPFLEGEVFPPRTLFTEQLDPVIARSARNAEWVLIQRRAASGEEWSAGELFRRRSSGRYALEPARDPERAAALRAELERLGRSRARRLASDVSDEIAEGLRALGYAEGPAE